MLAAVLTACIGGPRALGEQGPTKADVLAHISTAADHAANVLLDGQGQSRCEYNMIDGTWSPYEPAWHTGQLINALVEAFKVTGDSLYLRRARQAGDWWCGLLITDHPKLKGMVKAIHMEKNPNIVFATVSDGTPGLFNLYKQTGDKKYADVPTSAGKWMLANMYIPRERLFYDNVDPVSGDVLTTASPFWPDKKLQTLTDVARVNNEGSLFKDMYDYTKDEAYKKIFIALCQSLVDRQGPEGVWMEFTPNDKGTGSIHPRFNLWNAESLLEGYELTGDTTFLRAAVKTLRFYTKFQHKDGMIYYDLNLDGSDKQVSPSTSTAALAGILWMRLIGYGGADEFRPYVERTADCIMKNYFSPRHPDPNLRGGIMNIKVRTKAGVYTPIQRDLGTSFGIRFLTKYFSYRGFAAAQTQLTPEQAARAIANRVIRETRLELAPMLKKTASGGGLYRLAIDSAAAFTRDSYAEWTYGNGTVLLSLQTLAGAVRDTAYEAFVRRVCDFTLANLPLFKTQYEAAPAAQSADYRIFRCQMLDDAGAPTLPYVQRWIDRGDDRYKKLISKMASYVSSGQVRLKDGTLCRPEDTPMTVWADDLFMSVPLLLRMGVKTHDGSYFNDAAHQIIMFNKYLKDSTTGLYRHAYFDLKHAQSLVQWGRANGWIVWAESEALLHLPVTHPSYRTIAHIFKAHIDALLNYQSSTGLWHQVLDRPDTYEETSCTAMFLIGLARGIRTGVLGPAYIGPLKHAWTGVRSRIGADGVVTDICRGTGIGDTVEFYASRERYPNDPRGLGAVITAAVEMMTLK